MFLDRRTAPGRLPQRRALLPGLLLGLLFSTPAAAEPSRIDTAVDAYAVLDAEAYPQALRWENLEPDDRWVGAAPPMHYDPAQRQHLLRLAPGQSALLRLDEDSHLRLQALSDPGCVAAYELAVGDGRLFVEAAAPPDLIRGVALIQAEGRGASLVRVTRRAGCVDHPGVAVFVSVRDPLPEVARAREAIPLQAPALLVHGAERLEFRRFHRLLPDEPAGLAVDGPARLAISTRLVYPQAGDAHCLAQSLGGSEWLDRFRPRNVDRYHLSVRLEGHREPGSSSGCAASLTGTGFGDLWRLGRCRAAASASPLRLDYDTTPEYREPQRVGRCELPTGRLETRYLRLPEGRHRLQLEASQPLLARVMRLPLDRPHHDYLFASNAPVSAADPARRIAPGADAGFYARRLREALQWRRDNTRREGALAAAMQLQQVPQPFPGAEALRAEGERLWNRHTFYRNLESAQPMAPGAARRLQALPRTLVAYDDPQARLTVAPLQAEAAMSAASLAPFQTPPPATGCADCAAESPGSAPAAALVYPLPPRSSASRLRLLADPTDLAGPAVLWLQFDQQPPRRLWITPIQPLAADQVQPQVAELALAESIRREPALSLAAVTPVTPPASTAATAAPVVQPPLRLATRLGLPPPATPLLIPAVAELILPREVHTVRLWAAGGRSLPVALQYRTGKPFELAPAEYTEALAALAPLPVLGLYTSLLGPQTPSGEAHPGVFLQLAEVATQALAREQLAEWRRRGFDVRERLRTRPEGGERWEILLGPYPDRAAARTEAASLAAEGQATAVVERSLDPDSALTLALASLGSETPQLEDLAQHWLPSLRLLADRIRRYSAPVSGDRLPGPPPPGVGADPPPTAPAPAEPAIGDPLAQLEWQSERLRDPALTPAQRRAAQLAQIEALDAAGERVLAEQRLRGLALAAEDGALRQQAADRLLARYQAEQAPELRLGLLASLLLADPARQTLHAAALVSQLVEEGAAEHALTLGLLLPACAQPVETLVMAALLTRRWEDFESLVERLPAAQASVYRGLRAHREGDRAAARRWWTEGGTAQGQPWAALSERLEAVLHGLADADPVRRAAARADWQRAQWDHPGPRVWQAAPDTVLAHAGALALESVARDLLIHGHRASAEQPLRLQLQGPARLRLQVRPLFGDPAPYDGWIDLSVNGQHRRVAVIHNRPVGGLAEVGTQQPIGRAEPLLLELPAGRHEIALSSVDRVLWVQPELERPLLELLTLEDSGTAAEAAPLPRADQYRSTRRGRSLEPGQCRSQPLPAMALSALTPPPVALCARDPRSPAACAVPVPRLPSTDPSAAPDRQTVPAEPAAALERLQALAWWAEQAPARTLEALAAMDRIVEQHPGLPEAPALVQKLQRRVLWERVVNVTESAGVTTVPVSGWQPESPFLRARRALLPALGADAQYLYPDDEVQLDFSDSASAQLTLELTLAALPHSLAQATTVAYQLDQGPVQTVALVPGERQRVALQVPAGERRLRIFWEQGYANQFVRLRVLERRGGEDRPIAAEGERSYFISSREQPVRLTVDGPTRLRVDEQVQGRIHSRLVTVSGPGETVVLPPAAGETRTLMRIFRERLRLSERAPTPVAQPPVEVAAVAVPVPAARRCTGPGCPVPARLEDAYPLGGQEDGTWGARASLFSRGENSDESGRLLRDRFLELAGDYRRFLPSRESYVQGEALLRLRAGGEEPTLGLGGSWDYHPRRRPWDLRISAAAFGQYLETPRPTSLASAALVDLDWRLQASLGEYWSNTVSLGARARALSLDAARAPARIDRDVFSDYRYTHRNGCRAANSLRYRPWRDTLLSLRGGLVGNEDGCLASLDQASLSIGWQQFLQGAEWDLRFIHRRDFDDEDRPSSDASEALRLDLLWDLWRGVGDRYYAGVDLRYDLDDRDPSLQFTLGLNRNVARDYLDFSPRDLSFRDLRSLRQAGRRPYNLVIEDDPGE